jgi:transketolase
MSEIVLASTREAAGQAILELAQEGMDVVAVSADTSKSMYTTLLGKDYPERSIDTGIAEQNMVMAAAGLASTGKIAFAASYSVFTSMRCCEQLRTFIAYPNLNVKVIAGIGGLSAGIEGVTHIATEDLGIVRCLANMAVVAPSDAVTTNMAVKAAAAYDGPVYIRVGRDSTPALFDETYPFEIGVPIMHRTGNHVTLVSCGLVTAEVFTAAEELAQAGIEADVIEVHTLKPVLKPDIILESAMKTKHLITVEEHNVIGGLATVVSEIVAGNGDFRFKKLGLQDTYAESGTPAELLEKYGLNASNIVKAAQDVLQQ